jgi:hypothetical protein
MKNSNVAMLALLSMGVMMSMGIVAVPAFAGGSHDHHGHDDKVCKKNDDNNCNSDEVKQDVYAKNDCQIENENEDHSKKNDNTNELTCDNHIENINDSFFGIPG